MSEAPPFFLTISEEWLRRAHTAAGLPGVIVAMVVWREHRFGMTRRHRRDGTRPGFVKLAPRRVQQFVDMDRRTIRRALRELAAANLIETYQTASNAATQVRVIPVPEERAWTYRVLGDPNGADDCTFEFPFDD